MKFIGLFIAFALFVVYLVVGLWHVHTAFFAKDATAEITAITQKESVISTSNFGASYHDGDWRIKDQPKDAPPQKTFFYSLAWDDADGQQRVEEFDSGETVLSHKVGEKLDIIYSTLFPRMVYLKEEGRAGAEDEVRKFSYIALGIAAFLYLLGRIGIAITDRIFQRIEEQARNQPTTKNHGE